MNILVISQYFWPENFRINQLCKFLSKTKNVTVLTGKPSYPNSNLFLKLKKINRYGKINIIRIPTFPRGSNNISLFLNYFFFIIFSVFYSFLLSIRIKIDKIVVFGTSPPNGLIAAHIIRIIKKVPIYYWILDLWPNTLAGLGFSKKSFFYKMIDKFMNYNYKNCKYIFCQSNSIKKIISKKIKYKNSAIYFPSWCENLPFKKKTIFERKISNKNFNIMFTGNIGAAQDFESVIKSAKILKKNHLIKWIIVGSGRYNKKIKYLISVNKLKNNFLFITQQKPSYIKYLSSLSDCLLISLKKNSVFSKTIPGKLSNYMECKKPIVGMISGETNKIIKEAKCGLCCNSGDYKVLAKVILKMKNKTDSQRKIMGEKGYAYSKEYFNKKKILKKFEKSLLK